MGAGPWGRVLPSPRACRLLRLQWGLHPKCCPVGSQSDLRDQHSRDTGEAGQEKAAPLCPPGPFMGPVPPPVGYGVGWGTGTRVLVLRALVWAGNLSTGARRALRDQTPCPLPHTPGTETPSLGRVASPCSDLSPPTQFSRLRPKAAATRWALGPPSPDPTVRVPGGTGVGAQAQAW